MPLIQDPMAVFAFATGVCAFVFWSSKQRWAKKFYSIIPSIVLVYYIPTFASNLNIIPTSSPVYDWMKDYLLPFSLFILMITMDVPSILKIGPKALGMMLFGTLGVVVGGPIAYLLFETYLPPDTWKGLAALSGSWIGGGGNFAALKEAVGAPDSLIGAIIIVDTAVGYAWMGVLLFLVNYERKFDRWNRASTQIIEEINQRLQDFQETKGRPMTLSDAAVILAIGFIGAVGSQKLATVIYDATHGAMATHLPLLASIFSQFTWLVILISTLGVLLSFTPLRNIEYAGASKLGYAGLYLFLTSIGAKASLSGIKEAWILILVGAVWIVIHVGFLFLGARLLRAPLFLVAVGSQANIGGAASAPIVAAAYYESMAPVGLLMGILGYLLGNYAGLLCAFLLRLVGG
ncbi:MAG: DUF819 family protein [candidate division KSB1 bacterium]|nr:DUF819 family protein [candidate division KSB1 bacterium]